MFKYVKDIKELISKNQTSEALMLLHSISKDDKEAEITVLTLLAKYNELEVKKNRGTIDAAESSIIQNEVNVKVLKLLNALSNNEEITLGLIKIQKSSIAKQITIILLVLTIFLFVIAGIIVGFFSDSNSHILLALMVGGLYGGAVSFIALIITLVFRAILNK